MKLANLSFSDLFVGLSRKISKKVALSDIDFFSNLTSDFHPLHTNRKYAEESGYADVIAHGLLVSSYSSALIGMQLPGRKALIVSSQFEYKQPCYPGDSLSIVCTVSELDDRFSRMIVKVETKNQKNKLVALGHYGVIIRK